MPFWYADLTVIVSAEYLFLSKQASVLLNPASNPAIKMSLPNELETEIKAAVPDRLIEKDKAIPDDWETGMAHRRWAAWPFYLQETAYFAL